MSTANRHISIADYYFEFLKNLNSESKLDLISKLSQSLIVQENEDDTSLQSLFGAYNSADSAEEIIASIRSSRTFNRNTEAL